MLDSDPRTVGLIARASAMFVTPLESAVALLRRAGYISARLRVTHLARQIDPYQPMHID